MRINRANKKGQIMSELGGLGVGIAALAILLTIAFLILAQGREQVISTESDVFCRENYTFNDSSQNCYNTNGSTFTANLSYAYNSTLTMQNATSDIPGWVPLIVIAVIGSILLGLVALFRRGQ